MRYKYQQHFTDQAGNVVSSGTVTVFNANTTVLATVYASSGSTGAISGSAITTGTDGFFNFWVDTKDYSSPAARFKTILSKTNFTSKTYDDVLISPNSRDVYPEMFGAVGDGATDDTTAFNNACDEVRTNGGVVKISANRIFRITAQINATGINIIGDNKASSKVFVDYAGVGLYVASTAYSRIENIAIIGALTMIWGTVPTVGKIGVHVDTSHNHLIRNCHFHTLATGLKISGGGYYGITEGNLFQCNTISVHVLSDDASGPPNEQNILYNQFTGGTLAAPYGTGIKLQGTAANYVDGVKILGNGIENQTAALHITLTKYLHIAWSRYEGNTNKITYATSAAVDAIDPCEITGGGSYPSIAFGLLSTSQNTPTAFFLQNGEFKIGSGSRGGAISIGDMNSSNLNDVASLQDSDCLAAGLPSNFLALRFAGVSANGLLILNELVETVRWLKTGWLGIGATPTSALQVTGLPVYASNSSALGGGLTTGAFYRSGANPDTVRVVHAAT